MTPTELPDDELDRLMSLIRQEIAEQDRRAAEPVAEAAASPPALAMAVGTASPVPAPTQRVRLKHLLRLEDEAMVAATFRAVLGRDPTPGEAAYHRDRLRDGRLTKVGLVLELRDGKEGRKRGVAIKGLRARRLKARLAALPMLGPLAATLASWVRLPRLARNVSRVRHQTEQLNRTVANLPESLGWRVDRAALGLQDEVARLAAATAKGQAELTRRLEPVEAGLATGAQSLAAGLAALQAGIGALGDRLDADAADARAALVARLEERLARVQSEVAARVGALEERLAGVQCALEERLGDLRTSLPAVEAAAGRQVDALAPRLQEIAQRLAVLQRRAGVGTAPATVPAGPPAAAAAPAPDMAGDAFYAAFEDSFRGTREDIRNRQTAHLRLLSDQGPAVVELPVVDVGCGRGEWLELLRDQGIAAVGVDLNRIFLAENRARGLEVVEADALAYLRALPDRSARAVSGFHIIEHLPFDVLQALLAESLRVLAEGGLALFETPNPENLITAAHKFYYDPTHRHPIPPEIAAFLLRERGFRDVAILRLHPNQEPAREEAPPALRELLYGPQDYAVLGYR